MNFPYLIRQSILLLFIFLSLKGFTQKKEVKDTAAYKPSIFLIGKSYGDSVVLRWGPSSPLLWKDYNASGYLIERYEFTKGQTQRPVRQLLTNGPVKPWTLDQWKSRAKPQDSLAAAAAQMLYGKSKTLAVDEGKKGKGSGINMSDAFEQKYDQENRYSIAMFLADQSAFYATGLGLRFTDKTIQKGKTYIYSIHAATDPKVAPSDTSAVMIKTAEVLPLPVMPEIFYEEGDRVVKFKWDRRIGGFSFTSYHYERSEDGGKTFKRVNKHNYLQPKSGSSLQDDESIVLIDSLPQNYKQYHYRITGVTPFADFGEPSPLMPVMGKDKTPPVEPIQVKAEHLGRKKVKISWQKAVKEKDFAGYLVGRGESHEGPFTPLNLDLLGTTATEFTDTSAVPWGTNYYVISAVDTALNAGISLPAYVVMADTEAPAKPVGLSGKIDTTGIVRIKWNLGKEPDLMGYLVYFANAKDHEFAPVTPDFIVDSTFTDSVSLRTLTEKVYYRIVAFDKNQNPSARSETLELKRPDKIAPVPPVFIKFSVSDTAVVLNWAPSSSIDVAAQALFRKEKDGQWVELAKLDKKVADFRDTKVKKLTWYEYSLIAYDDDGLQSERSFPVNVRVYDSGVRKQIETFSAKAEQDKKNVTLTWSYPVKDDFYFMIYRSYNGSGLQMYKQINSGSSTFQDLNLSKGNYEYAVKAIYKDGGQSAMSVVAKVEIK